MDVLTIRYFTFKEKVIVSFVILVNMILGGQVSFRTANIEGGWQVLHLRSPYWRLEVSLLGRSRPNCEHWWIYGFPVSLNYGYDGFQVVGLIFWKFWIFDVWLTRYCQFDRFIDRFEITYTKFYWTRVSSTVSSIYSVLFLNHLLVFVHLSKLMKSNIRIMIHDSRKSWLPRIYCLFGLCIQI